LPFRIQSNRRQEALTISAGERYCGRCRGLPNVSLRICRVFCTYESGPEHQGTSESRREFSELVFFHDGFHFYHLIFCVFLFVQVHCAYAAEAGSTSAVSHVATNSYFLIPA